MYRMTTFVWDDIYCAGEQPSWLKIAKYLYDNKEQFEKQLVAKKRIFSRYDVKHRIVSEQHLDNEWKLIEDLEIAK